MPPFGKTAMLLLVLFALGISGCAGTSRRMAMIPPVTIEGLATRYHPGQIISLPEGRIISFEELISLLAQNRLVFIGEVHSDPEDHLIQVQILQALMEFNPSPDAAMEFFQRDQQKAIDRYFQGKISETQFLKEVDWRRNWGFPYRFYRPLVQIVRQRHRGLFAINAPREVVRKVARKGLHALTPEERNAVARHIDLTFPEHRAFLKKIFSKHRHGDLGNFEYFYQAQCVWEDTMAERITEILETGSRPLVVFAGNGHILNRYGIPERVASRTPVTMATLVIHRVQEPISFQKNGADFLWLTGIHFSLGPRKNPWKKMTISDTVTPEKSKGAPGSSE